MSLPNEPSQEKANNCGFRPGLTQTDMYSHRSRLEARNFEFKKKKREKLYYLYSENKVADKLCSHCTADLLLCFRICLLFVFLHGDSNSDGFPFNTWL